VKNKKLLYGLLGIIVIVVIVGIFIFELKPFLESQGDPFGELPKGTSPNCGPENRYKFDITINSKQDFVSFLKENRQEILDEYGNNWVKLDNFKDNPPHGEVDWTKVLGSIETYNVGNRTIYSLDYNPLACDGFTIKMTNDGHVSVYGCCGI